MIDRVEMNSDDARGCADSEEAKILVFSLNTTDWSVKRLNKCNGEFRVYAIYLAFEKKNELSKHGTVDSLEENTIITWVTMEFWIATQIIGGLAPIIH